MYFSTTRRLSVRLCITLFLAMMFQFSFAQPSSIGDYVWYDTNNNGIQESGEPAYVGSRVWLYTEFVPGTYTLVGQTVTDASGIYEFNSFNAFLGANRDYYITIVDPLLEPGSTNPTEPTLANVGSDALDNDGTIAPASFTPFAGQSYVQLNTGSSTGALSDFDFGFYTLCSDLSVTLPATVAACTGETLDFTAVTTGGTGVIGYDWTDGTSGLSNQNSIRVFASQTFSVTATDEIGCTNVSDVVITVTDCPMDLNLTKSTVGVTSTMAGDGVSFNIEICNEGQSEVDSIEIHDIFPSGYILVDTDWTVITASTTQSTATLELGSSNGTLPAGGLAIGACVNVTMDVLIDECASTDNLVNTALINYQRDVFGSLVDADSTPGGAILDEDDTDTASAPVFDLALRKTIPTPSVPYDINEAVTFQIEIFNQGNVPATNVNVIDHVPMGFVFDAAANPAWTYNAATRQAVGIVPGTIAPGTSATLDIILNVASASNIDDWTNIAEILSAQDANGVDMTNSDFDSTPDSNPSNDVGGVPGTDSDNEINDNGANKDGDNVTDEDDHDSERIEIFDLALIKQLTTSAPYFYGQDHLFNITVCNQGSIVAMNIEVTDYIPNGYIVNAASSLPFWTVDASGNLLTTTMTQLGPGDCEVLPLTLTLQQTTGDVSDWINYSEITGAEDNEGNDMTNFDSDSTPGSNSLTENSVQPGDADDDNLNGNGPNAGEDEDDHDPAGPKIYDVALSKTLPAVGPFEYGDFLGFVITVTNQGNETLSGVDIYDVVPSGFTFDPSNAPTWTYTAGTRVATTTINDLLPGQSKTVNITLEVNASVGDIDAWTNYAEVFGIRDINGLNVSALEVDSNPDMIVNNDIGGTPDTAEDDLITDNGTDYDGDGVSDEDDHDPERIEIFDLALIKETFTPGPYQYGQDVTFNITVQNQGNTPATNIVIEDYIPAGYSLNTALSTGWSAAGSYTIAGPLMPGASEVVQIVLIVNPSIGADKAWVNYSEIISAQNELGEDRTNQDADSNPNTNSATENSVLPDDADDNNLLGNGPNVGEDEDDHDPADIEIFDLSLTKTTTAVAPLNINDVITFDIEVCNQGNVNPDNITILDYIPEGMTFAASSVPTWTSINTPRGATTTVLGLAENTCVIRSIDLTLSKAYGNIDAWTNVAEISSAFDANNVLLTDADSGMDNNIANDAGGTPDTPEDNHIIDDGADGNGDGITDEDDHDPTRLKIFDLALDKKLVTVGPYIYGQLVQFDITVYNQGNEVATQVTIEDYISAGYSFNAADNPGWTGGAQYTIPTAMAPNTSVTVPVFLVLEQTPGNASNWFNYAEITSFADEFGTDASSQEYDSTPGSNGPVENSVEPDDPNDNNILGCGPIAGEDEDDHDVAGVRFIDGALRKTLLSNGPFTYGDIVTFEIEIFNQGAEPFTAEIVDYIPNGLAYAATNNPFWTLDAATNYAYANIPSIDAGDSRVVTIDLELLSYCDDADAWTNRSEISKLFDTDGNDVSFIDYDSEADALNGNDVGGTIRTPEDDMIMDDGTDRDGDGITDEDDEDPAIVDIFDLALKKVLVASGTLVDGQDFTFNIIVENQGNLTATNIGIEDYVPAGFTFDITKNPGWTAAQTYNIAGPLLPADAVTIPIVLTYVQTTGGEIDYTNYAEIISAQDENGVDFTNQDIDSTPGSNTATELLVEPLSANDNNVKGNGPGAGEDEDDHDPAGLQVFDVALRKTIITGGPYRKGDIVQFQIEVFNQGGEELRDVEVTDYYAMGIEYLPSNNGTWTPAAANGYATTVIPVIPLNGSQIVTIDYLLVANTDQDGWTNVAEVSEMFNDNGVDVTLLDIDSSSDQIKGNDTGGTPLTPEDDLITDDGTDFDGDGVRDEDDSDPALLPVYDAALTKVVVTPPPYAYQQLIQFDITVYNQGNLPLTQVTVEDYLPAGFSFDVANNPGWTAAATYTIPTMIPSWTDVTFPIFLTIEQTSGDTRDWLNYAEVVSFADGAGNDQSANDYDSTLGSNSAYELQVEDGDLFDDNIFGSGQIDNEDEDDHDPAGIQIFDLALNKKLNQAGPYVCGTIIAFDIEVYNQGNETVTNVEVEDYFTPGLSYQASNNANWTLDVAGDMASRVIPSIDPGESVIISISFEVLESLTTGDDWFNNAEIRRFEDSDNVDRSAEDIDSTPDDILGNDVGGTADTDEDDHLNDDGVDGDGDGITDEDDHDPERISVYDVALSKEVVTPAPYTYYQDIMFNITVCNQGNEILNNIQIEDYLPTGFGFDPAINAGWTAAGTYMISTPLGTDQCTVVPITLKILQTNGGSKMWANYAEVTSFQDANGIDRSGEDFDSTPGSNSAYENLVREGDAFDDDLTGNGQAKGEDEDDHDVAEIEVFDLALNKRLTAQPAPYLCGRALTFDIEVFNQGNMTVTDVDINDYLPSGLEYQASNDATWTYNAVTGIATTTIGQILPGETQVITLDVIVVESTGAGDNWYNNAEITEFSDSNGIERSTEDIDSTPDITVGNDVGGVADSNQDDHVDDDGVDGNMDGITDEDDQDPERISIYDLALIKEVVTPAPYMYYQNIVFEITVCNQGNEIVNNIQIEDYLPAGFGFDPSINAGWTAAGTYTIASPLDPDACTMVPITLQILQTNGGSKMWANYSEIIAFEDANGVDRSQEDFDSTPASNNAYENAVRQDDVFDDMLEGNGQAKGEDEDDHDVAEIEIYDLALNKTLDNQPAPYKCGRILTFEFEIFNQGNMTATDIEVSDYIPSGFRFVTSNIPTWGYNTASLIANTTIPALAPGASTVISIDLEVIESTDPGDNWYNSAEISNFKDVAGINRNNDDIDSTPDTMALNDVGGTAETAEDDHVSDDGVNGNMDGITDEDDQDPERISVYDLALIKEVITQGPYTYYQNVLFNITVCNQGNETTNNILIEDYLPIGFGFDAAANTGWTAAGTYTISTPLSPDDCVIIPLNLQLLQTTGGDRNWANYAEIMSFEDANGVDRSLEDFDSTPASDNAYERDVRQDDAFDDELEGNGQAKGEDEDDHDVGEIEIYDLALNKTTDDIGPFRCDDLVTFYIEVFNQGNETATDIVFYDQLQEGLQYESVNNGTWTHDPVLDRASSTIPSLAAGASVIVPITVRVVESTSTGDGWYNNAEILSFRDVLGQDRNLDDIDSTPDADLTNDVGGTADTDEDDHVSDDSVNGNMDGITDEDDQDPERIKVYDLALKKEVVTTPIYEYYQDIQFQITVCNQGNEAVQNITIEDYLPIGYGFSTVNNAGWNASRQYTIASPLQPDDCIVVPITFTILQTNGGSKHWANYSEIIRFEDLNGVDRSLEDFDSTPASNNAYENLVREDGIYNDELEGNGQAKGEDEDDHDVAEIIVQDLALQKEIITQGPYSFGQPIVYRMTVYNQGNDPAYDVEISDYIPVGLAYSSVNNGTWTSSLGSSLATTQFATPLLPGDNRSVDITLTMNKLKDDVDAWDNRAEISSAVDQFNILFDDIDSEMDGILGNDVGGTPWTAEDGLISDTSVDDDGNGVFDEDDEDVARIAVFDLALRKVLDTPAPYVYNQTLDFTITVFNQGNEDGNNIQILDHVPPGLSFDPVVNPQWTLLANGDLQYNFPNTLVPLDSVSVPLTLEIIRTDGGVKHWTNYSEIKTASGRADIGTPNRDLWDVDSTPDSDSVYENNVCLPPYNSVDDLANPWDDEICGCGPVYGEDEDDHDPAGIEIFDLAQIKTTTATTPFRYGDIVPFVITIFNQGSLFATDVVVTDYVPCGFEFDPALNTGWTLAGNLATRTTTGMLLPGQSTQMTINLRVIPCISDSEIAWTNYTEISSSETEDLFAATDFDSTSDQINDEVNIDDNEVQTPSDEDDHDVERIEVMDFALKKTTPICDPFLLGDTIRFDVTVYNQGNVVSGPIGIIDTIHSGFIYDTTLNPNWIMNGSIADYTIPAGLAPQDSVIVPLFLIVTMDATPFLEDYYNRSEISFSSDVTGAIVIDADSNADRNFYNDNFVLPTDSIANIFDINDDEITENFPVYNGNVSSNDDEDDSDPAKISAASKLGDYVWKDINGNGIQDFFEPGVEGVVVTLRDCNDNIIETQVTDSEGFYQFVDVQPGFYYLLFDDDSLPRGCAWTFQDVDFDDTIDSDVDLTGRIPCRPIAAMQDSTIDAGLLILASIGDFVWEDIDGNGVQDIGEPGIEGVVINLIDLMGVVQGTATTDINGEWIIEDIYPGSYYLQYFTPAGYDATFDNNGINDALDSDIDNSNGVNTTPYTYLDSGEDDLDWDAGFYRCAKIGETVWYDVNENDIRETTENGINGITVNLYRLNELGNWVFYETMLTGNKPGAASEDGYYKFCAAPGTYYVEVILPPYGLVPARANIGNDDTIDSDVTNANGSGTTSAFTLLSSQSKCDLGHGYYPMAQVGDRAWHDENSNGMQDPSEQPIPGVQVRAYDASGTMVGQDVTDAQGRYNIGYLAQEGYYLSFTPPAGFAPTDGNMGSDEAMDSDVDHSFGYLTTDMYYLMPGDSIPNIDAGFIEGILPLDWVSFTAKSVDDHHLIEWTTANEINNDHFVVERRLELEDTYTSIAIVEATDAPKDLNDYIHRDFDITVAGNYYYRLRQVDFDGNYAYSDVVRLNVEKTIRDTDIKLSPNPAINEIFLEFNMAQTGNIQVDILDASGKLVRQNAVQQVLKAGEQIVGLDVHDIVNGVYTVQITLDGQLINKKLIVLKN